MLYVLARRDISVGILALLVLGPCILAVVGFVAWRVVVRRGQLTWMRLARAPARAMACGDHEAAEQALRRALSRARRFAPDDHRRGLMLLELAGYVKHQGRYPDALALYDECVEILAQHRRANPFDYFIALNNYAIYFIHIRNYVAAQRLLERALDLTLLGRKGLDRDNEILSRTALGVELMLHLNLVFLFIEMGALPEARDHLDEADAIFPNLPRRRQAMYGDHYRAIRGLMFYALGQFASAGSELDKARDQAYPACMRVRAKLCLVRRDFVAAEALLRQYLELERQKGSLHRPELRDHLLDLAESEFGQMKNDDAFRAFQEARSVHTDFTLPPDRVWRSALETWRERARELKQADVVALLDAELYQITVPPEHSIIVSDRLRVRPLSTRPRPLYG